MIVLIRFEHHTSMVELCCPECRAPTFCCTMQYAAAMSIKGRPQEILCRKCGGNPEDPPPLKELLARPLPGPAEMEKEAIL